MDRYHLHAGDFGAPRQFGRVQEGIIPAQPGFQRDRHRDRTDNRLDQRQRVIEVFHQGRSACPRAAGTGHLLGRAPHVDVDDLRAVRLNHPRGLGHPMGLAPGKLHRGIGDAKPQLRPFARTGLGLHHLLTGDHLTDHQPRAEC